MNNQKIEILVSFDVVLVYAECKKAEPGYAAELFSSLSRTNANIDLISLIPPRRMSGGLSFSVFSSDFTKVLRAVAQLKETLADTRIEASGGYSKVTLRGERFAYETGVAARFFNALREADSETMLVSASDSTISALIRSDELDKTVAALEKAFPESETYYLN